MCFGGGLKGESLPNLDSSQPARQVSIADYSHSSHEHPFSAPAPKRTRSTDPSNMPPVYKTISTDANGRPIYQTKSTNAAGHPVYRTQSTDLPMETMTMGNDMAGRGADEVHHSGWKKAKGVLSGFEPSKRTEGSGVIG